jgi:hypothetical protein
MVAFFYAAQCGWRVVVMGGQRIGAGRPADPNSMRSQVRGLGGKEDFVTLPPQGRTDVPPEWPLMESSIVERDFWDKLWASPQSLIWEIHGLEFQIANYVRTYFESVERGASANLKSAVIRMEGELGLSLNGMKTLKWQIGESLDASKPTPASRKTSSGNWLNGVRTDERA